MTYEQLPVEKPFRLSGNDLTVFEKDKNGVINIWFRDLQSFIAMPNRLNGSWYKKLKHTDKYYLIKKLPR